MSSLSATRRPLGRAALVAAIASLVIASLAPADEPADQPARQPATIDLAPKAAARDAAGTRTSRKADPGPAAILPISGEINDILARSLQRRIDEARAAGAKTIVFEMDTPGGLVTSALDISTMLKKLQHDGIHTVAWVHDQAYSAGALISVSCQQIVMSTSSRMGDCAPIMVAPGGELQSVGETERAKIESPILQDFADSAALNEYPPLLCRAMVTVGEEVWWLENPETGERRFVSTKEKERLISDDGASASEAGWRLVTQYTDPVTGKLRDATQPVDRADTLLTVSQSEAVAYGLATGIADDPAELVKTLGAGSLVGTYAISGWEWFAMWLNSPMIRGILFVIMLIGAYMEFQTPGVMAPGIVALCALVVFLAAPYAAGLASIWTMLVLAIGVILLLLEIFVIPGFGVAGILGILLVGGALVATFVPPEPPMPGEWFSWPRLGATWESLKAGVVVLTSALVIAAMGILLLARYLPDSPLGRGLVLGGVNLAVPGAASAATATFDELAGVAMVGDIGVVETDLKPSGRVRFGHALVEVASQTGYVEPGRRVQVVERHGAQVIVRELPEGVTDVRNV